ncbi:MAG TPA: extracellular solute-binding protein [Clostridiaceae bacterium]|nr:extracellular solute-binding protein [Clostridiaceae bacterium]
MKSVKGIAIVILAIMLLTLVACGKSSSTTNEAQKGETGETKTNESSTNDVADTKYFYQKDTSPFTVDWYVDLSWWKWNGQEWGEDLVSSIIKEKTGATINFMTPASDDGQQLATMIASNTLPDVITIEGWWKNKNRALTNKLAAEGMILAYNDLIEKYAPEMMNTVIRKDVFDWYAEDDGKTYLLPNYAYSSEDLLSGEQLVPNGCITIRKDMWEAIGSPDMTTPENFLNACKRVKDEIKEYNGKEIIPMQLYEFSIRNSILWLCQYFATPYEDENGNYLMDLLQPQYKEALKFYNTAYRMGLIHDANFTDTREQINEKIQSGRVFAQFTAPQDFVQQMQALYNSDSNAVYIPVELRNSAGDEPVLQDIRGFGWLTTAITKNAKKPERILGLFEYLLSDEGLLDTQYGKEGLTYTWNEDRTIITRTPEAIEDMANGSKKFAICSMMQLDNYCRRMHWDAPPTDPLTLATNDICVKQPMAKYSADYNAAGGKPDPTDPRFESMQEVATKIENAEKQNIAKIIISKTDEEFERNYNAAIEEYKSLGLDELIEWRNECFQNAKKALGQKYSWKPLLNK